jgi:hypothetical protein
MLKSFSFLKMYHIFLAAVSNSPKLDVPVRPKRLGTNLGAVPRLGAHRVDSEGSSDSAKPQQSPSVSRWRRAVAQVNNLSKVFVLILLP